MATYYCPSCADALSLKAGIDTSALLGTPYQQGKFAKHTTPPASSTEAIRSVFDSGSTQYYAECINETILRGFVEIDNMGRKNILFPPSTGSSIGTLYKWGEEASRPDTIVAVKTSQSTAVHSMLTNSSQYGGVTCARCDGPLW